MFKSNKSKFILITTILIFFIGISLRFGSVNIELSEILEILGGNKTNNFIIFTQIRTPRVIFGIIAGINLAISGLLLQTVLKNPLADPGIMGISSGAALGATMILLLFPVATSLIPIVTFTSGLLCFFLIVLFSWDSKLTPVKLILAGVAINAMTGGVQSFLMSMFSDKLHGVITWINGDLSGKTWSQVLLTFGYSIPIYISILILLPKFNALNLSDETIFSLGISPRKYRLICAIFAVYLAAITVSQTGVISFVGLIVPHLARLLVGGNLKKLLPFTVVIGAIVIVFADFVARMVISPLEIPIGTVMSIVGGPFFLYLLKTSKKGV